MTNILDTTILKGEMIAELTRVFSLVEDTDIQAMIDEITRAKRIFIYGLGRERLVLQTFAMRLMHLGLTVHVVGDVTSPRIGTEDLFFTSTGTGYLATVEALVKIARNAGARVLLMSAADESPLTDHVDLWIRIPAQTMRANAFAIRSVQPMGTLFEQAQLLVCDLVVIQLSKTLRVEETDMVQFHTNLE